MKRIIPIVLLTILFLSGCSEIHKIAPAKEPDTFLAKD